MTHGISDQERLGDLKDALEYAAEDFSTADFHFREAELAFSQASIKRERAHRELMKVRREYEALKAAVAGMEAK